MSISLDPGRLSVCAWNLQTTASTLAELIADEAVANERVIPERLLAAYHDALQLKATIDQLSKIAHDQAMREVHGNG